MKVVIIGGVAGGASTAARLRRLDESAEIIILEKGDEVSYANCGLPYHIGGVIPRRDALLVQTPEKLHAALNIDVRVRSEVIAIDAAAKTVIVRRHNGETYTETWDKLVLCPGGVPIRPATPGDSHPKIFTLQNVADMDRIKRQVDADARRAVIIGGGFIGIEVAESLRGRGMHVDLVEKQGQILPFLDLEMAHELEAHMLRHGVRIHLNNSVHEFHGDGDSIACELAHGERLRADFVVSAIGVRPSTALAQSAGIALGPRGGIRVDEHMRTSHPDIYAAGDAVEVRDLVTGQAALVPLAGPANRQGRVVADNIAGRPSRFAPVQGTSIIKVFDMTAGCTGASERRLQQDSIAHRKIYVHPSGHAGYYPGTAAMHLKLLFAPVDGKLLGAQVVGFDGVDKRIDVLAVALRAGLTVYDLEELELAYAPPYGSAKDPVNMAGFVAANLLRGDAPHWYAEQYPEQTADSLLLDVRSVSEYARWHIPGALNIPHTQLRASLDTLPRDKPLLVYCRTGFRSYLALRILKQAGFASVATLSGGTLTFSALHEKQSLGYRLNPEEAHGNEALVELVEASGRVFDLDARGLHCPGPIEALQGKLADIGVGDEVVISASDPVFLSHLPCWCSSYGHWLLDTREIDAGVQARIRKGAAM